ncbi:MAG: aspartokinase [Cyclobacteriaceae bacterium]|jgi:aspartokinase
MGNDKSILSKTLLSMNNSCAIVSITKTYAKSQAIFKEAKEHGYLLFKFKSQKFSESGRSCFVVSNQCLKFITSYLEQKHEYFETIDYLQNFNISHPNVSLIKITNMGMDNKDEMNKAISILKEKEIDPIAYKLFDCSYCILLNSSDSAKALSYLHDKIIIFDKIPFPQAG